MPSQAAVPQTGIRHAPNNLSRGSTPRYYRAPLRRGGARLLFHPSDGRDPPQEIPPRSLAFRPECKLLGPRHGRVTPPPWTRPAGEGAGERAGVDLAELDASPRGATPRRGEVALGRASPPALRLPALGTLAARRILIAYRHKTNPTAPAASPEGLGDGLLFAMFRTRFSSSPIR